MDRNVPASLSAERAVLGALLQDPSAVDRVVDHLPPEAFHQPAHRHVYESMLRLYRAGETVEPVSIVEELRARDELGRIGGRQGLGRLLKAAGGGCHLDQHVEWMSDRYLARRLVQVGQQVHREAVDSELGQASEALDRAEERVLSIARELDRPDALRGSGALVDAFCEAVAEAEASDEGPLGLASPFPELDELTGGLKAGQLVVVAGRPSMGKSALALDMVRHAVLAGEPAGVFSLEMPAEDVVGRMLCAEAELSFQRVKRGNVLEGERAKLERTAARMREAPLVVSETPSLTILQARSRARRIRQTQGLSLLCVDYLQLMHGPDAHTREQEIAAISRGLKALAMELEVPVLAISQLSRAPERRRGRPRPRLADLRESGAIEQDADLVLFPFRPEVYLEPTDDGYETSHGTAELIIGKQRNGPLGLVDLEFKHELISFRPPEGEIQQSDLPF